MFKRIWHISTIGVFAALQCAQAQAQTCTPGTPPCLYSVKFVCGNEPANPGFLPPVETAVTQGNYATSINIHNFHSQSVTILKSAVIANEEPPLAMLIFGAISKQFQIPVGPGQAFAIDCNDIVTTLFSGVVFKDPFIEGFVELRAVFPLSVTAVYTAQPATAPSGPVSIEVVPVQPFVGS